MEVEKYVVSESDFKAIADQIWKKISYGKTPESSPKGAVLGGQPGAGKSNLIKYFSEQNANNVIKINADTFRSSHPQFYEIQNEFGVDAPKVTGGFSGKMAEEMLHRAIKEKYSLVIEGTFKSADCSTAK